MAVSGSKNQYKRQLKNDDRGPFQTTPLPFLVITGSIIYW